jgi:hypothetical protein
MSRITHSVCVFIHVIARSHKWNFYLTLFSCYIISNICLEVCPFCTKFLLSLDKHLWCCSLTMMEFTSTGIGSTNCDRTKDFRLQRLTMLVEKRNFLIFHFDWNKSFSRHGLVGSHNLHCLSEQFLFSISVIILFLIRDIVSGKEVLCYSHLFAPNWDINILDLSKWHRHFKDEICIYFWPQAFLSRISICHIHGV